MRGEVHEGGAFLLVWGFLTRWGGPMSGAGPPLTGLMKGGRDVEGGRGP